MSPTTRFALRRSWMKRPKRAAQMGQQELSSTAGPSESRSMATK
jgi:hypothetical protein